MLNQISVFVSNKSGRLKEVTGILAKNNIDIRALSIADTADFGILRLIVNNPAEAEKVLKENGLTVKITKVIGVSINDSIGSLHDVLGILFDEGISVEYLYAFITRKDSDAYVILRVEDNERAIEALSKKGKTFLTADEVASI